MQKIGLVFIHYLLLLVYISNTPIKCILKISYVCALIECLISCSRTHVYIQVKKKLLYVFFRTMPADQVLFTDVIPGRFNSWNKQSAYPFNDRYDEISLDSDRGAYNNEKFRGKDAYGKYIVNLNILGIP
jgi:hypothetical protein